MPRLEGAEAALLKAYGKVGSFFIFICVLCVCVLDFLVMPCVELRHSPRQPYVYM